ncbi:MAG: mechanosensitive ion channel domain-containing protein [Burkholderiales bacterium]
MQRLLQAVITAVAFLVAGNAPQALAVEAELTPEQATRVGGDFNEYGEKLTVLRDSSSKVFNTAPRAGTELVAAWRRISEAPSTRGFFPELGFIVGSFLIFAIAVFGVRRATAKVRQRWRTDALRARGAGGVLALDALDRAVVAALAYILFEQWCDFGTTQDYLAVALVWAAVRWWIAMWVVLALLRPGEPELRLVPIGDACALALSRLAGVVLFIGYAGISVMPVLLRAQLAIPTAQFIGLVQGVVVFAGGLIGLWIYRRLEMGPREASPAPRLFGRRFWFATAAVTMVLVWLAWAVGAILLKFSIYHSLVWSVRIAAFAYIVDSVLGLSARASQDAPAGTAAPVAMWIPLAQRSIRVAAILAIAILFAEVWLVEELAVVERQVWEPVRRSLITAALTLVSGYVAWRYLHDWTEARLRAAVPLLGDEDDGEARPASRLTTVLPVLRILLGITIVVMAVLVALSQLGVNIGPLLAGAGVVGLAISFGSQALVRDIVSGIFFMTDDAFRVGEYIDTGKLKGTVEKITLRSVRLRHHNGQVHTIPFGQLTSITNFSRDWQTVKFNVRLARDTDVEVVRKTVKKIGMEMMQHPELGKELLQPLKLQGVADIAENALVFRLKFTARPAKPSWVQREALKRIYKVFGEKGIEFASSTITVQAAGAGPLPPEALGAAAASATPRSEAA